MSATALPMRVYAELAVPTLWIGWWAYWTIAARGVKAAVRRESLPSRLAHIVPLVIAGLLLAVPLEPGWWSTRFLPSSWTVYWIGTAILAAGLLFTVWPRRVLGRNWSATVTLKEGHELVRVGPYRWIRHPIYTGILLGFAGSAIARGEWRGVLAVFIAGIALWRKLRMEERWMIELFGGRYEQYRRETWALIPYLL